ncbi:MAG: insulinase family protein [Anaerolineae bacterium]|nr:insulinase family protein [Anaerolineae bacterium]
MDLTFQTYTLSNGITLIVKENHHAQSVVVRGRLRGGANLDPVDKTGLASFTTSLMRRGTTHRNFAEINETVESVGAMLNFSCGRHLTTVSSKSLAEDFNLMVELIEEGLTGPTFPEVEIERVRGQLITGLREMRESTRGLAQQYFREQLYTLQHPYGRPFNGTLESVPTITQADVVAFYQNLHPQDGIFVVVGDVEADMVYQTMEATLGQWQPAHSPPDMSVPTPLPLETTKRHVEVIANKTQADLMLGNIGPKRTDDDFYAAYVGDTILGHLGLGGRIGQVVRDREGLAYYARTSLMGGIGADPWCIYAGVNPANVEKAIALILTEIRRFREEPVSDQELADAKSYLTGILPLQMETNEGVANMLLQMNLYQLGDDFVSRYPALINAITKADIQAVARTYLSDETYVLSIAGPVELPS